MNRARSFGWCLLFLCTVLSIPATNAQLSVSEIAAVRLSATVQASPARITLAWPAQATATGYTVYRKLRTGTAWGASIASLGAGATSYQDNAVAVNTLYEYKVVRASSQGTGHGYLCSGIEVQPTDYMGKMILLVDNTLAAGLATEIAQLEADLRGDGWVTIKHEIAPGASVTSVRNTVISSYNTDPTNVRAVYIIGHVPVPYSGNHAPDGHTDTHLGAWPCDGYYGELNGTWTDNTVNETSSWPANDNIPGDGKFDQSDFPSTVELQVGRVDLGDLTYFANTHQQRLSAYLTKAHNFKVKGFTPMVRGIVYDDLQDVATPLAGSAWMSMAPLVGTANITEATPNQSLWLQQLVNNQSYLWTYGSGGGLVGDDNGTIMFHYLNKSATSQELANGTYVWGGVFNMCMGSYVGDWNNRNNVMRAVMSSGSALTHVFSGEPNYWFHTLGMGENIGSSLRMSMNNTSLYVPQTGGVGPTATRCAISLLGDPSLRLFSVAPPSGLQVTNNAGNASFTWTAAEGTPAGYNVYAFNGSGVPTRVNGSLIVGTSFNSAQTYVAGAQYMVRAVKLEVTQSGSYYNQSLGATATAPSIGVQLAADVLLEGAYDTGAGQMRDDLRAQGLVPLAEPYTALGFAQVAGGGGETTTAGVLAVTGSNAIVDWVRVELRSTTTPSQVLATRQALVQRDGDIVATDGTSPITLAVGSGSYRVAVRHRNHLGAMTSGNVALSGTPATVEFDAPATGLFGTEATKAVGGVRCLWAGNTFLNNELRYIGTNNDRDPILVRVGGSTPNNTVVGYFLEDVTMNGTVSYIGTGNDRDPILVNIGGSTPNNVRSEQLP